MTQMFYLIISAWQFQHNDAGPVPPPRSTDQGLPGGRGKLVAMLPGVRQLCPGPASLLSQISGGVLEH